MSEFLYHKIAHLHPVLEKLIPVLVLSSGFLQRFCKNLNCTALPCDYFWNVMINQNILLVLRQHLLHWLVNSSAKSV